MGLVILTCLLLLYISSGKSGLFWCLLSLLVIGILIAGC
jgi:hypothetical protein